MTLWDTSGEEDVPITRDGADTWYFTDPLNQGDFFFEQFVQAPLSTLDGSDDLGNLVVGNVWIFTGLTASDVRLEMGVGEDNAPNFRTTLNAIQIGESSTPSTTLPLQADFGSASSVELINELTSPQGAYGIEVIGEGDDIFGDVFEIIQEESGNNR